MNATDAVKLCRYVKAACPQQAMDEYTPQAWADLLGDVPYEDAQVAVRTLAKRQPFVAPSEIIAEVKKIRAQRVKDADHLLIPPVFTNAADYQTWLKDVRGRLGDGESPESINATSDRGPLVERPAALMIEASTRAPAVRERKREVKGHTITQAEIDAATAALAAWQARAQEESA